MWTLDQIRRMRSDRSAPVDIMGCDKLALPDSSPRERRFQTLVALLLSSQTKDQVTAEAARRLFHQAPSPEALIALDSATIKGLIYPVGFYNRKGIYLRQLSERLIELGDVPTTVDEIAALPGIGPKMAYLAVDACWHTCQGIGVDVHVHRIANRLGWAESRTPEQTRMQLEDLLPDTVWPDVNHLLVGFGQTICQARKPRCQDCLLRDICPSSSVRVGTEDD